MNAVQTPARIGSLKLICKVPRDFRKQAASTASLAPRTLIKMFTISLSAQQQGMAHRAFMDMFAVPLPATTERKRRYGTVKLIAIWGIFANEITQI